MKKLAISALAVGALFAQSTSADLEAKIKQLEKQVQQLKQMAISNQKKVNPIAANNHLFWSYDLRSSIDIINYKLTNGNKKANNILSNRVRLTAVAKPSDNLKATLQIEANNIYGMDGKPVNSAMQTLGYDNSNWTANETPDDTSLRVSQAFFNYYFGENNEFMFSAGRRPATEGYPAHFRAGDEHANSPLAHLINLEFDGMSLQIKNDFFAQKSEKFEEWGTWLKFCAGRGYSPNSGKFTQYPYDKDDSLKINDFFGMIFVPYDDGQYALWTETVKAWNVKGMYDYNSTTKKFDSMKDAGDYFGFNAVFKAAGIGDGINDYLDDTNAFISFALSKTIPHNEKMLGSDDSKTGTSWWIGADMPAGDDGRWGFNFIKGSKYYRSMTYAEDTLIGSIAAVRGKAYEVYYNGVIIPHLTWGVRATIIKYDYTGSNAFFGDDGTPVDVDNMQTAIKDAKDIRAYIRYNF